MTITNMNIEVKAMQNDKTDSNTENESPTTPKPPKDCLVGAKPCAESFSCEKCVTGCSCSLECRVKHGNHIKYCPIIFSLEKSETGNRMRA